MKEEIKELCFFMICGQTLLYFQSGRKYERICKMIFQLLILAGIAGILLNFLQSVGIRGGEITAEGGALSNMQRSMEEALSRQLNEDLNFDFLSKISLDELSDKYTYEKIKSKYNYIAQRYELEIEKMDRHGDRVRIYVRSGKGRENDEDNGKVRGREDNEDSEGSKNRESDEDNGRVREREDNEDDEDSKNGEGGGDYESSEVGEGSKSSEGGEKEQTSGQDVIKIKEIEVESIRSEEIKGEEHPFEEGETAKEKLSALEALRSDLADIFETSIENLEVIYID